MKARHHKRFRPQFESLEDRRVMAAGITAALDANGVLAIQGTESSDMVIVRRIDQQISIDGISGSFAVDKVKAITVDAKGGDDHIRLDSEFFGQQPIRVPTLIAGGAGNDVLCGGGGEDRIDGGDGNDYLWGGEGADVLSGGAQDDRIYGAAGNDAISGDSGNDLIDSGEGANWVYAGEGNDTVYGGSQTDYLFGQGGNDSIWGRGGHDLIDGGADQDQLYGEAGFDLIFGGDGNDGLIGGDDNDVLVGGNGRDVLFGNGGHDLLDGGADVDWVFGQEGDDVLYDDVSGIQRYGGTGQNKLIDGHLDPQLLAILTLDRVSRASAFQFGGIHLANPQVAGAMGVIGAYQGGSSPYDQAVDLMLGHFMVNTLNNDAGAIANGDPNLMAGILMAGVNAAPVLGPNGQNPYSVDQGLAVLPNPTLSTVMAFAGSSLPTNLQQFSYLSTSNVPPGSIPFPVANLSSASAQPHQPGSLVQNPLQSLFQSFFQTVEPAPAASVAPKSFTPMA